jgi:hypothetical protein
MKTKFFITAIITFSMMAFVLSCEKDFLDKSDPGNATVDGFFQTADDFKLGINGIYDSMADSNQAAFWGDQILVHGDMVLVLLEMLLHKVAVFSVINSIMEWELSLRLILC